MSTTILRNEPSYETNPAGAPRARSDLYATLIRGEDTWRLFAIQTQFPCKS
jgi:hypothetical protein